VNVTTEWNEAEPLFGEGSIAAETVEKPFNIVNEWFLGVS
jgi:hypothetical protein